MGVAYIVGHGIVDLGSEDSEKIIFVIFFIYNLQTQIPPCLNLTKFNISIMPWQVSETLHW